MAMMMVIKCTNFLMRTKIHFKRVRTNKQYTPATIPIMGLIAELSTALSILTEAKVHCTIFEYNNGCIELVKCPRMRPRIKHMDLKYHHIRSKVKEGLVTIKSIYNKMQRADMLTKAKTESRFKHLKRINQWMVGNIILTKIE